MNDNIISQDIIVKNYKIFFKFLKKFKTELINNYKHNYYLKIKLNFIKEEGQEEENKDDIYNITSIYTFYEPIINRIQKYIEDNILINFVNSNSVGFLFMLIDINKECYSYIKYKDSSNNIINQKNYMINDNKKDNNEETRNCSIMPNNSINNSNNIIQTVNSPIGEENFFTSFDINKVADKLKIIEFIKIVEYNNSYNGFIKEISNGYYLTCNSDNLLSIYDIFFNPVMNIKGNKDSVFSACERVYNDIKDKTKIQIIASAKKELNLCEIDLKEKTYAIKSFNVSHINCYNCFEMRPSNYVVIGQRCGIHYINLFTKNTQKNEITDRLFFGGLRVNGNILVLTSNSILTKGDDRLIFYNTKSKNISNEIEGYSFIFSPNGIALMPREEIKNKNKINNRILLCACKKYKQNQKNGILLVNPQLGDNRQVDDPFVDTGNFEVHCFCPILIVKNKNKNYTIIDEEYKKNIKIIDTDYFLVGGFDKDKMEGKIKMYKVNFQEKAYNTKIEFIQDIDFDEDEYMGEFDGPINCILQSKITGNIIASCYNKKIYLFTAPNIDYYLENDSF